MTQVLSRGSTPDISGGFSPPQSYRANPVITQGAAFDSWGVPTRPSPPMPPSPSFTELPPPFPLPSGSSAHFAAKPAFNPSIFATLDALDSPERRSELPVELPSGAKVLAPTFGNAPVQTIPSPPGFQNTWRRPASHTTDFEWTAASPVNSRPSSFPGLLPSSQSPLHGLEPNLAFEPVDVGTNPRIIPEGLFSGFSRGAVSDPFKIFEDETFSFDDILGSIEPQGALQRMDLNLRTGNEESRLHPVKAKSFMHGSTFNGNDYSA